MTQDIDQLLNGRHLLAELGGGDVFEKAYEFQKIVGSVRDLGMYPYFQPLEYNFGTEAVLRGKRVLMMGSGQRENQTSFSSQENFSFWVISSFSRCDCIAPNVPC
jgi:hypothetical protein